MSENVSGGARATFGKAEHLCSRKQIKVLFAGRGKSLSDFPIRLVYRFEADAGPGARVLVSVSKRYFKRAVDRNLAKRRLREAYRLSKHELAPLLDKEGVGALHIAIMWIAAEHLPYEVIEKKLRRLLVRIAERHADD